MTAMIALVRRELLEHRTAFIIAPAVLLAVITLTALTALFSGHYQTGELPAELSGSGQLFAAFLGIGFMAWSVYLLVALVFYFSDSFSADRKGNAMLFWKSMPQTDFKILSAKALAGISIFPALILGFGLITGLILYLLSFRASALLSFSVTPAPLDALWIYVQLAVVAVVFYALNILWYAPLLAFVAGLSTRFGGWSIPLAVISLVTLTVLEKILLFGEDGPIAGYLGYRLQGIIHRGEFGDHEISQLAGSYLNAIPELLARMDWTQTAIGLVFTLVVIYLASEYRRRYIIT